MMITFEPVFVAGWEKLGLGIPLSVCCPSAPRHAPQTIRTTTPRPLNLKQGVVCRIFKSRLAMVIDTAKQSPCAMPLNSWWMAEKPVWPSAETDSYGRPPLVTRRSTPSE